MRFLVERGLLPPSELGPLPPQVARPKVRFSVPERLRTPLAHLALLLVMLSGVALLRSLPLWTPPSPLAPLGAPDAKVAQLLLVVDPWAEVLVDGQLIETTPFARPLRLRSCLLYTSPSPRDRTRYRMPSSA